MVSRILVCFLLIQGGVFAAAKKDLARLAILNFADETGTKNYGYLPGSLTEAIDKSLQHKFEYVREEPAKSEAALKDFAGSGVMNPERAGIFARNNNLDIVVYGAFTLDRATKEVVVTTYVAFGNSVKFRRLKERKNPADATIFSLAEKVADDIVAEMTEVAKAQSTEKSAATETGKLELKKESVTSWDSHRWLLAAEGGFSGSLGDNGGLKDGVHTVLRLTREAWKRSYFGFDLGYASTTSFSQSCTNGICTPGGKNFDALYGTAVVGYAVYPWNRWRIFADAGLGSAFGGFKENVNDGKIEQLRFTLRAAAGIDFLITSFLSAGVGMRLLTFPGSGESFAMGQPGVRVTWIF